MKIKQNSLNKYKKIPRLNLVNLFTPVEECNRLKSELPNCPNLFIKRDDLIGYFVGGNKVRKLEYMMAEVLKRKATAVVTVGSVQSNHARTTAMVARRLGLKCVLVLNGDLPETQSANLLISKFLGINIHFVKSRKQRDKRMNEVAEELQKQGERVYKIPLGASDDIGSFGFVRAYEEIYSQQQQMGINFDAIIIGSSSGGTQAGLEVGKRLFNQGHVHILGISPDDPAESIKERILAITQPMMVKLSLHNEIEKSELWVDDAYYGEGYGISTRKSEEATQLFNQVEGLLLDRFYTSKVAAALIDYCQKGIFKPDMNVLFWHTGGLMALFI